MVIARGGISIPAGLLLLAWTSPLPAAPSAVHVTQSAPDVECFDFVEVTLRVDRPDAANAFTDVNVTGEFARGRETPLSVEGFCDAADGSLFRVRFMPSRPGDHRFSVRLRQGEYAFKHDGTFSARPSRRPGPVLVDRDHPFHFVRAGTGEHWFWNGTTTYHLLAWDEDTIVQSVERLARLGVNRIRVALCGRTKDGKRWNEPLVQPTARFAFKMEPWPAVRPENLEDPGYDVSRFNVGFFQKAERMLRLAREHDLVVSIIFYVDGGDKGVDPFGKQGMGGPDEQRYYRYVVARLSAFVNVMRDVTNEWHLFRDEEWVNQRGTNPRSRSFWISSRARCCGQAESLA